METKIKGVKEHPLLLRDEIIAEVFVDNVTLSKADAKKLIASELNSNENIIVINNIKTHFGSRKVGISAYKYKDEESLNKIELKKKDKQPVKKDEKKE